MAETAQTCPACRAQVRPNSRYPTYMCRHCVPFARAPDGRPVVFTNSNSADGVSARYGDTGEEYPDRACLIGDLQCRAREAHLGGVVIEAIL